MAKNKVKIDVEVDDKGNLKKVGDKAKKASKNLDSTARSAQSADRRLKGAAQASSNTTKNFAKMSQGITGGLVPAYAILASNVFAVSAAFNFLKDAGNLVALQRGQQAYAASTGVALRSLSNDIIAATDAQINFTDASQAAAIGTASGLSGDQLTRLGTAAKDASIILGRDVTDSFNRLVRGVTKAEPELLDELGIILRLDDATRKYAESLNLNQKDLTAFQRSQAVAIDVLEQAEQKYSRIIAVVDPGVNTFNKLGKAFDDIINKIKEFAAVALGPFAEAITQFPALGVALLGIFGKGVLTAALPGLQDIGESARESAEKAQKSFNKAKDSLKEYTTETRVANKAAAASRAQALGDPGFKTSKPTSGFEMIKQGRGSELTSQQLVGMKSAVANSKTLSKKMKREWQSALDEMLLATKKSTKGIEQEFKKTTGKIGLFFRQAEVKVKGAFASMKLAAASFAGFAATALSVISWVSLIATLGVTVYQFFKAKKASDETTQALGYAAEKVAALNDEFKNFNEIQNIITEDGAGSLKYFTALGERIGSVGLNAIEPLFKEAISEESLNNFSNKVKEEAEKVSSELKRLTSDAAAASAGVNDLAQNSESWLIKFAALTVIGQGGTNGITQTTQELKELQTELENTNYTFGDFLNTSDDQRLKDLGKYFTDQAAALSTVNENFGGQGSAAILSYLDTLNQLTNATDLSAESFQELFNKLKTQQVEVNRVTQLFKDYERGLQDVNTQSNQLRTGFLNVTKEEAAVDALRNQIRLTQELNEQMRGNEVGPLAGLTAEEIEGFQQNKRDLEFAIALDNLEKNKLTRANELAMLTETSLRGRTKGQRDLINLELKSQELQNNRAYIEEQINILKNQRLANDGILNNQEETRLRNLQQELELNTEKEKSLERQASLSLQLLDTAAQALENNLQSNIAAILKGNEKSLKDAILNIGKGVLDGIADTLSKQFTDMLFGKKDPATRFAEAGEYVAGLIYDATTGVKPQTGGFAGGLGGIGGGLLKSLGNAIFGKKIGTSTSAAVEGGATVAQGIGSIRAGGILSSLINLLPFGSGGMAKGGFRAYASGGLVKDPTIGLIGEGRYNEAVVPLPNGKAIPVDMKGSTQENNIVINVSAEGAVSQQGGGNQGANLGKAIAMAVQKELQNQKRSGGILSPYGAA